MALATADDVSVVYETDRDASAIEPFVAIAEAFITERLGGKGLSATTMRDLVRYYAAHLMFVTDAGVHDTLSLGDVRERFTKSEKHPGLFDSRFGRMVVMLDPTGTLAEVAHPKPTAELRLIPGC